MSDPPPPTPHPSPPASSSSSYSLRDYRKGNWTLQETLTLIDAKRRDDERRAESRLISSSCSALVSPRSAELRWKWVENYCWSSGCFRSQNQCNDKWDNLLRDYKKVRDHEARHPQPTSYWAMEKQERKERNLPTSMAPEVYQALTDAIRRRNELKAVNARGSRAAALPLLVTQPPPPPRLPLLALPPPPTPLEPIAMDIMPKPTKKDAVEPKSDAAPAPPPVETPALEGPPVHHSGTCDISQTDEDDQAEPEAKRRKIQEIRHSVVEGVSILARTLLECEERHDKRHHDLMELQEKRLRLESERAETNRQSLTALVSTINSLSCAIQVMISDSNRDGDDDVGGGRGH